MLGRMLAGTDESPGEIIERDGLRLKRYRGMGSPEAVQKLDRYSKLVPEGISGYVPYRGSVKEVLRMIVGGIKSGMGYIGASNLEELKRRSMFLKASSSETFEKRVEGLLLERKPPIDLIL